MLLLTALVAQAADGALVRFGLDAGVETSTNDPFVNHHAARLGASFSPVPWVEIGVAGVVFPGQLLGPNSDLSPLGHRFSGEGFAAQNRVSVDISRPDWQAEAVLRIRVLTYPTVAWTFSMGGLGGAALTHTVDDPDALQVNDDDPRFLATARQVHPGPVAGVYWDATSGHWGVRVRAEWAGYVETIDSNVLETKQYAMLGGEVLLWF